MQCRYSDRFQGSAPPPSPTTSRGITRALVPELQKRGAFRRGYEAPTLRGLLGLDRPASRYSHAGPTSGGTAP